MSSIPLATRIRPKTLAEIIGQQHILGEDKPLFKMIKDDRVSSIIFYGPSGTGKTTLAEVISKITKRNFVKMNAANCGVKEIRSLAEKATMTGISTVLFLDECHRATTVLMDTLLPFIENGVFVFIGATTENVYHSLTSALLSRCQVYVLESLSETELTMIMLRGVEYYRSIKKEVSLDPEAVKHIIRVSCGDGRKVLTILEMLVEIGGALDITLELARAVAPSKYVVYGESLKYDYASWEQGALQASDPDAAIYALAKWLESGEDPRYIARRIIISASEDCASSPFAAMLAHSAYVAACEIGRPECDIVLAHAVVTIATSKRDKSAAVAIWSALKDIKEGIDVAVPKELRDCHYKGSEKLGHGAYHDGMNQSAYVGINKKYYKPW